MTVKVIISEIWFESAQFMNLQKNNAIQKIFEITFLVEAENAFVFEKTKTKTEKEIVDYYKKLKKHDVLIK